jgi:MFS family permease
MEQIPPTEPTSQETKKERYIFGISFNVLLLGFVSLFTDISSEMITAIMPLFILSIAGANAIIALGFIDGISNAVANIIKGISGYLSDKLKKRKAFVVLGYTISNIAKPFIGLQTDWRAVLGLKVTDRIGKGIRVAPRDALISYYADQSLFDLSETNSRSGLNFGIHRTFDTLGAIIGALLAALLLFVGLTYGQVILWSILPGFIAILVLIAVKDVKEDKILALKQKITSKNSTPKSEPVKVDQPKTEKMPPHLKKLILTLSIMEFASVDIAFVMVRAADVVAAQWVILLYAAFNIVSALLATPLGKFADKIGKQKVITTGLSVLLVISLLLTLPIENWSIGVFIVFLVFPLFGVYMSIVETGSKAFVSDITGKNKKGKIYGYYYFLVGALSIPESILFALLYQYYGYAMAFGFATVLLAICIIIFAKADFTQKS